MWMAVWEPDAIRVNMSKEFRDNSFTSEFEELKT